MKRTSLALCLLSALALPGGLFCQSAPVYDVVLKGGRVMDPETGLDAVRHVGIRGDRIAEISAEPPQGKEVIDVSGLAVAPGFIDLHVHGMTNEAHEYQMRDGVTTALELESGIPFLREWLAAKTGSTITRSRLGCSRVSMAKSEPPTAASAPDRTHIRRISRSPGMPPVTASS